MLKVDGPLSLSRLSQGQDISREGREGLHEASSQPASGTDGPVATVELSLLGVGQGVATRTAVGKTHVCSCRTHAEHDGFFSSHWSPKL
jgi:hypothetical protein